MFNFIVTFFKGLVGWKDGSGPSYTDCFLLGSGLVLMVITIDSYYTGRIWAYYEKLMEWTFSISFGMKGSKGLIETVQKGIGAFGKNTDSEE